MRERAEGHMPSSPSQQNGEQHPGAYTDSDSVPETHPGSGMPLASDNNEERLTLWMRAPRGATRSMPLPQAAVKPEIYSNESHKWVVLMSVAYLPKSMWIFLVWDAT